MPAQPPQPAQRPSRRQILQSALAATAATALPPAGAQAERGLAYEVSPWAGPLAGFSLVDTTGKTWQPADVKGRPVLLNFWASWCEPCRAEMPTLQQVADLYGPDQLLVLAVNFKERPERALQFTKSTGITLPVLLDVEGHVARRWEIKVFPTTLAINRRGQPRLRVRGELDWTGRAAEKLITSLF
jgi:thiol-disulfide isomerase/thioredoxin